jgi:Leucine-rich repeat (LRR) protein
MSKVRTPKDIFQNVLDKKISKNEAFRLLHSLINESNNPEIRVSVIEVIESLSIFNESVYSILEKALISDESDLVRYKAANVLINNFKISDDTPLFYALENEDSVYVLRNLLQMCLNSEKKVLQQLQETIKSRISKFYNLRPKDAQFILDIDYLDYLKFRENYNDFVERFNIQEDEKQDILREKAKLSYKGLGRVVKSVDGFILGLKLHDFREIPASIKNLIKLEYLEIKHTDLCNFDPNYDTLLDLKYLILSNNKFDFVPNWIIEVAKRRGYALKYLKMGVDYLEAEVLGLLELLLNQALVKLEEYESFNPSLLYYFKNNRNGNIIGINISSDLNRIGVFPEKLCNLKHLKELIMPNQNIRKIPECISKLENLELLDLSNNKLTELPKSLKDLKSLKQLKLEGNTIKNYN